MKQKFLWLIVFCSFPLTGCLPSGQSTKGGRTITVYGFSIMKESLEKEIYPAFAAKWKLVRKGNPKGILDFPHLAKAGIKLIHPDPVSSGGDRLLPPPAARCRRAHGLHRPTLGHLLPPAVAPSDAGRHRA